jgi:HK97 family phage prohead protease
MKFPKVIKGAKQKTLRIVTDTKQQEHREPTVPPVEKFVVVDDVNGGQLYAKRSGDALFLCVPNSDGVLLVSNEIVCDSRVKAAYDLGSTPVFQNAVLKHFETRTEFEKAASSVLDDAKNIVDFKDITLEGLASTFSSLTPKDRDGDTIGDGAFDKTIKSFMQNPVMLIDHVNSVDNIAGSFTRMRASNRGLEVQSKVSNAPELRKVRFLIGEGHLKAFSIGGLFKFSDANPRLVDQIELFEISLVAVPANPDALFSARSISIEDAKTAFKRLSLNFK